MPLVVHLSPGGSALNAILVRVCAVCLLLAIGLSSTAAAQDTALFAWPGATIYDGTIHGDAEMLSARVADGSLTAQGFDALLLPMMLEDEVRASLIAAAHKQGLRVILPIGDPAHAGPHATAATYAEAVGQHGIDALYLMDAPADLDAAQLRLQAQAALQRWQQTQAIADKEALGLWVFSTTPHPAADAHLTKLADDAIDAAYARLATRVAAEGTHPLHHLTLDAQTEFGAAAEVLLAPGSVLVTMTDAVDPAVQELVDKLLAFRHRHAALALGQHEQLEAEPYTFYRGVQVDMAEDKIIAVLGAGPRTRLNVSRVFPDDTALRDALSGKISMVSYGMISFRNTGHSVLLLEVAE